MRTSKVERREAAAAALRDAMGALGPSEVARMLTAATGGSPQYDRQHVDAWTAARSAPDVDDAHLLEAVLNCRGKITGPLGYMPEGFTVPAELPAAEDAHVRRRVMEILDRAYRSVAEEEQAEEGRAEAQPTPRQRRRT